MPGGKTDRHHDRLRSGGGCAVKTAGYYGMFISSLSVLSRRRRWLAPVLILSILLVPHLPAGSEDSALAATGPGWSVSEFPVVVGPGDQKTPRLDASTVVYRDVSPNGIVRLMKKPLEGGGEVELVSGNVQAGPDSDSGAVVWQNTDGSVCLRSLAGGEDRCVASGASAHLAFSGLRVVTDASTSSRISLVDFENMRSRVLDSSTLAGMRYDAAIDGDRAVWVKERGYAGKYYEPLVVSHDIVNSTSEYLTKTGGGSGPGGGSRYERKNPTMEGGRVFYQQKDRLSGSGWDIYEAVPDTYGMPISQASGDQVNPSLSGNLVVFQDNRGGYQDESGNWVGEWDIYLKDLVSGAEQPVCMAPGNQTNPVIKGNVVLWEDDRNGNRDIYAAMLSPGQADLQLTQDFAPLLVMHSDEDFAPMKAEMMVALPGTVLVDGGTEQLRSPDNLTLAALGRFGSGSYLDLPAPCLFCGPHIPSATIDKYNFSQYVKPYHSAVAAGGYQPAVYGRVIRQGDGMVIQYWLNYLFNNHPMLSHEGDWELVEVELNSDSQPVRVSASQHGYGRMRNWQDVESRDGRPVIYVAKGSHANYFNPGDHFINIDGVPIALALDSTMAADQGRMLSPQVVPISDASGGAGAEAWLDFGGQWGELSDNPGGNSPVGPKWSGNRWSRPFAWDGLTWDGFAGISGSLAGLEVRVPISTRLDVFGRFGGHVGPAATGGVETGLPGARHIELTELGQKVTMVPGAGLMNAYRVEISAQSGGQTSLELTFPDAGSGAAVELRYDNVPVGSGIKAWLEVGAGMGGSQQQLSLDVNGDGKADDFIDPASIIKHTVDLLAPARIADLRASSGDDGSIRLAFTAPGDDGNQGTSAAYAVRYSTEPINEDNWYLAEPVDTGKNPLAAGSPEDLSVGNLPGGAPLYFAVRAVDEAGNISVLSPMAVDAQPNLSLTAVNAYWGSFEDYRVGTLTVKYRVGNSGSGPARDLTVRDVLITPGNVTWIADNTAYLAEVAPGATAEFNLRFHVSPGCYRFRTTIYATCIDLAGREMWLPEPPPLA